jgi:hypothetical protein
LRALLNHDLSGTETGRWLRESGVEAKFRKDLEAQAGIAARNQALGAR